MAKGSASYLLATSLCALAAAAQANATTNYTYDALGRLVSATSTGTSGGTGLILTVLSASTIGIESMGPSGLKTFNYTVADSLGASSTGNVSITVTTVNTCQ